MRYPKSWITALFILFALCIASPAQAGFSLEEARKTTRKALDFRVPIPLPFVLCEVRVISFVRIATGLTLGPPGSVAVEVVYGLADSEMDGKDFVKTVVISLASLGTAYAAQELEAQGIPAIIIDPVLQQIRSLVGLDAGVTRLPTFPCRMTLR